MNWQEEDILFLESARSELTDYLNSPVFEWQMRRSRILLTPGRVLLSLARLSSVKDMDKDTLSLISMIKETINQKRVLWQRKFEQEFPRRLRIWENYIGDCSEEGMDKTLPVQIINRVILKLFEMESPIAATRYERQMNLVDEAFRKLTIPGDFIWDFQLAPVFLKNDYWFLYCKPVKG